MKTLGAHRLDMGRPLIDEDDVEAGIGEVGSYTAAIGARSKHRDFLVHTQYPEALSGG